MSRSDAQRIDDLEHHLMVAESMGREFESALARKDAALGMALEALKLCNPKCSTLVHSGPTFHSTDEPCPMEMTTKAALAACREETK